ncbi:MAG: 8-amino-7-oxononanoate synthase [Desulfobulbaceae bacterium]|nr:8-amino-7-oxononanoate synthase [Desulfobulbaceae bacterium]
MNSLNDRLRNRLNKIETNGKLRCLTSTSPGDGARIIYQGKSTLNLSGNDYLGLARNRELLIDFYQKKSLENCLERYSLGSGGSRLMTGNFSSYPLLEQDLAKMYRAEAAIIFNSGYHLNIGILPALTGKNDLILADKLCHASLIDGMRLSRAEVIRYRHNDYQQLEELLIAKSNQYEQIFLVTESIFSMDGDLADLSTLVALKKKFNACLLVDEAHSVGIRGLSGLGLAEEQGCLAEIDILIGTFGKAWGGQGAFVVCSELLAKYLINTVRSFIFTTALPPVNILWLRHIALKIPQMQKKREHVRNLRANLGKALLSEELRIGGDSHILPVFVGESSKALRLAKELRQHGYWITGVRPPTVPEGTARLRLSLNAAMDWCDLEPLPKLLASLMEK